MASSSFAFVVLLPLPLHLRSGAAALEVKRRPWSCAHSKSLRRFGERLLLCPLAVFLLLVRGIHTSQENSQPHEVPDANDIDCMSESSRRRQGPQVWKSTAVWALCKQR